MWLLKFHLAFSILCLITYCGARLFLRNLRNKKTEEKYKEAFKGQIKGDWLSRCFANIKLIVGCFVPIINVLVVLTTFIAETNPDWIIETAKKMGKIDDNPDEVNSDLVNRN